MSKIQLFNQDCIEGMKTLADNSVDLIVTDPPYPTTARGNAGNSGGMLQKKINRQGRVFNHNDIDVNEYASEFYRILKEQTHCYVMTNHINLYKMLTAFQNAGFKFTKCLIWDKGNKIMGQYYMSQFEYILFFRKGKAKKINHCGTSDILSIPNKKTKGADGKNLHDTEKPVELMKILIENSSNLGDLVLDPFAGIGASAIACAESGRNFIGYELDNEYYSVALQRTNKGVENERYSITE